MNRGSCTIAERRRQAILVAATCALATAACGRSSPTSPGSLDADRFLPAEASFVLDLDVARLRASPHAPLVPKLLPMLAPAFDAVRQGCGLDVLGTATRLRAAVHRALPGGDATLVVSGLPRDRIAACVTGVSSAAPRVTGKVDGERFELSIDGTPAISGAILASGEVVLVSRGGRAVTSDAWRAEVAGTATARPAYLATLPDGAVRVSLVDTRRTLSVGLALGDPLVARGTIVAADEATATDEANKLRAIFAYLGQGGAGTGRVEPRGATIHADLTIGASQLPGLVAIIAPALPEPPQLVASPQLPAAPGSCASLRDAVARYLTESLAKAPAAQRATMERDMSVLVPALQQAFTTSCETDRWSATVIACHVDQATALNRFEQCRMQLDTAPRANLDRAVSAALAGR